ncbi:hypothetical protein [Streptomyces sp. CAU 1734]|uniref:hypothetical protein n=1 Tax=Streptomyces sp. CAU 1734 TaxID=3140360 RepID=UPI003261513C
MTTVSPQTPAPEPHFDHEAHGLAPDAAPRLFAVIEEYGAGTREENAWVLGWGMAHEDGPAEVIRAGGSERWRMSSVEQAVARFGRRAEGCSLRLVWLGRSGVDGPVREADAA